MIRLSKSLFGVLATCGLLLAADAWAVEESDFNFDTTDDLVAVCGTEGTAGEAMAAQFACRAFLEATMQYHDAISDKKHLKPLTCPPSGTTIADTRTVFLAWARSKAGDAKLMGELPVVGVVRALAAKYPCR